LPHRNKGWVPPCPDFLRRFVALIHSMRLSLMKGAHADLSSTAWQEIGGQAVLWLEWDNGSRSATSRSPRPGNKSSPPLEDWVRNWSSQADAKALIRCVVYLPDQSCPDTRHESSDDLQIRALLRSPRCHCALYVRVEARALRKKRRSTAFCPLDRRGELEVADREPLSHSSQRTA
jgi:hypothetical protein